MGETPNGPNMFVAIYECSVWQLIYVGPSGHT